MITVVSGAPPAEMDLMMRMLEAGGLPAAPGSLRAGGASLREYVEIEAARRLPDDNAWLASIEGSACIIDALRLPHLPASREYRIIFILPDPDDDPALPDRNWRRILRWLDGPRRMAVLYCRRRHIIERPQQTARNVANFMGLRLNLNAMAAAIHRARVLQPSGIAD